LTHLYWFFVSVNEIDTTFLVGKPEGRRPLGRHRHRWEDGSWGNRVWRCGLDSFGSVLGQVVSSCEHGDEPSGSIKCGEFLD
jgi:hypothetical protein